MLPGTSVFQSTHPLRGATLPDLIPVDGKCDFNPRTPCGVRLVRILTWISAGRFQSTHPLRGATVSGAHHGVSEEISIHAPLAGCDAQADLLLGDVEDFNPRTPCGVRPLFARKTAVFYDFNPRTPCGVRRSRLNVYSTSPSFQSTHPLRGATLYAVWHIKLHPHQRADQSKNKL